MSHLPNNKLCSTPSASVATHPIFAQTFHFLALQSHCNPSQNASFPFFSVTPMLDVRNAAWNANVWYFTLSRVNFLTDSAPENSNLHLKFHTFSQVTSTDCTPTAESRDRSCNHSRFSRSQGQVPPIDPGAATQIVMLCSVPFFNCLGWQ